MESNNTSPNEGVDELDLFELFENLWNQRLLITAVSLGFGFLGICYAIVAPEKWTAELHISHAPAPSIASLTPPELMLSETIDPLKSQASTVDKNNVQAPLGRLSSSSRTAPLAVSSDDLMRHLVLELRSVDTLLQFDAKLSQSIFKGPDRLSAESRIEAASGFLNRNLKITSPFKGFSNTTIALTMESPTVAATVLNGYVKFVDAKVVKEREQYLKLELERAIQINEFKIKLAKRSYSDRLEEDLALLEEALRIAQGAGIRDNKTGLFIDRVDNRLTSANTLYLRGERLLKAEIEALQARVRSTALIPEVRYLEAENELLRSIVIDTKTASSFFLEKPAIAPTRRDSPNTKLVVALALVLGGVLGVLTALIRTAVRNRRTKAIA